MLNSVVYPGIVLKKVTDYDAAAWGKLTAHADVLFEQQKKAEYIALKPQDATVPNPFIMIRNLFAQANNALLDTRTKDSYFIWPQANGDFTMHRYTTLLGAPSMTRNLAAALVSYIERDPQVSEEAGITGAELRDLRRYAAPEKHGPARTLGHA